MRILQGLIAVTLLGTVGCASKDTEPAQQLAQAAHDANVKLKDLKSQDVVFTRDVMTDLVHPIETTGNRFIAQLAEWGDPQKSDVASFRSQVPEIQAAARELNTFLGAFGIDPRTYDPKALISTDLGSESGYWKIALCDAAVVAAGVTCAAGCSLLAPEAAPLCIDACHLAADAGIAACNNLSCWDDTGCGCDDTCGYY